MLTNCFIHSIENDLTGKMPLSKTYVSQIADCILIICCPYITYYRMGGAGLPDLLQYHLGGKGQFIQCITKRSDQKSHHKVKKVLIKVMSVF